MNFFNLQAALKGLFAGREGVPDNAAIDYAFANAHWLKAKNAAGTADLNLIRANSSDQVEVGDAKFASVASAVNQVITTAAATGNAPSVKATGSDPNVGLTIGVKGSGTTKVVDGNGNEVLIAGAAVASAVNEITVTNAATANAPSFTATGGDTNISLQLSAKGTGIVKVGNSATGTCSGTGGTSTVTASAQAVLLTTAALTTAAGATHTITLTNTKVAATSIVTAIATNASATTGFPLVTKITPGSETVAIEITNIAAAAAINGTLTVAVNILA